MAATAPTEHQRASQTGLPRQHRPRRRVPATTWLLMVLAGVVLMLAVYVQLREDGEAYMTAVAAEELRPGAPVTDAVVSWTEVRADAEVAERLVLRGDLGGGGEWVAAGRIAAGEPMSESDVQRASAPDEQRAMSVPVDRARAVSGALTAGDRVDVILADAGEARYLATGLEVLAVAGEGGGGLAGGAPMSEWAVTVAVDADTALRLAGALAAGELHVTRSTGAVEADAGDRLDAGEGTVDGGEEGEGG